jgi:drug/metabolite transporter (DMT)-like permease
VNLSPRERAGVVACYLTLCLVWGTTYNFIKVAVGVFDPFFYSAVRFILSGLLMVGLALALRAPWPRRPAEYAPLVVTGLMLLVGGNGLLSMAAMEVPSGITSVISPLAPIVIALMASLLPDEERLSLKGWVGVAVGAAGVLLLFRDELRRLSPIAARGMLLLLGCSFFWSLASVIQRRHARLPHAIVVAAVQMLAGGLGLLAVFAFRGEPTHAPVTRAAVGAVAYLVVVGGCVGFSCWAYLVSKVPVARAATYGYVNPAVALLVGWLFLGETFLGHHLAGMALAIAGVVIVNVGRRGDRPPALAAPIAAPAEPAP